MRTGLRASGGQLVRQTVRGVTVDLAVCTIDGNEYIIIVRQHVEQSGAIPLAEVDITPLADEDMSGSMSESGAKEHTPLVSRGLLHKLVVEISLVVQLWM
jgi:hypothetical protein